MRGFLLAQPILQVLERRSHGGHVGGALVLAHFDQLSHRGRRKGAQARQQSLVGQGVPANQQVHRDLAAGRGLPGAKTPGARAGQRLDELVLVIEIHKTFPALPPQ
jgi:hypothetical protein